eukprot:gnl/MRDRNA2_/MRDRNA2_76554_c0_seq1.p2 gnl/MRDRNA2_/MRDRNA2_76554_c0~~gnl/MRDRNA2_/MRDRNA2_76554_c0_seq1.p2  ORF type:complete len:185 (-),score=27.91 gnl/MRDRNA2_/MRDRNA2_76554_c0_seq1:611-1165(-)
MNNDMEVKDADLCMARHQTEHVSAALNLTRKSALASESCAVMGASTSASCTHVDVDCDTLLSFGFESEVEIAILGDSRSLHSHRGVPAVTGGAPAVTECDGSAGHGWLPVVCLSSPPFDGVALGESGCCSKVKEMSSREFWQTVTDIRVRLPPMIDTWRSEWISCRFNSFGFPHVGMDPLRKLQ